MKIMLIDSPNDPVRAAFVHLDQKREGMKNADGTKSKDKFEITLILTPGGANEKKVQDAIAAVAKEKYGDNWIEQYREFADDQKGLRKGNLKRNQSEEIYPGFEGMNYVVAKNESRPATFNRAAQPTVAGDQGFPYAGCYVNAEVDLWALKKQGVKKRLVVDALGIQFSRDGDAFGAGSQPTKLGTFTSLSADDADAPAQGGANGGSAFD